MGGAAAAWALVGLWPVGLGLAVVALVSGTINLREEQARRE